MHKANEAARTVTGQAQEAGPAMAMDSGEGAGAQDNSQAMAAARDQLIVALDVPTIAEARALVERLGDAASFYKVGLGLQLGGGDAFARELKAQNKRVFLDYKYYDIRETVKNAVARAADFGIDFLTVHGVASILEGAVAGRGQSDLKILCVTVLTSMDAQDIQEMGFPPTAKIEDLVVHRALKALECGVDGVVASALEAGEIRRRAGGKAMIVTPGIRPAGGDPGDQKRVATPYSAIRDGADYLVVGRPITGAADPAQAARAIAAEMARAIAECDSGA